MKCFKRIMIALLMVMLCFTTAAPGYARSAKRVKMNKLPGWASTRIVAHAAGNAQGYSRTNSLEALTQTSNAHVKAIELDFSITNDNELICTHDWKRFGKVTDLNTFMSSKIYDTLTPMPAKQALTILNSKGKYLVVDAKSSPTNKVYKRLIQLCDTLNIPGYKKRIIPQIYSRPDYKRYKKIYNFPYGILTLYRRTPMPAKRLRVFAKFCKKNNLVLTISKKRYTPRNAKIIKKCGAVAAVHTVNTKKQYNKLRKRGAAIIYTDKLIW